jgi:hypothetical protein
MGYNEGQVKSYTSHIQKSGYDITATLLVTKNEMSMDISDSVFNTGEKQ